MTTPSDHFPDNESGKNTAYAASSEQESRGETNSAATPPQTSPPLKQGLPLYMRTPRNPSPTGDGEDTTSSGLPVAEARASVPAPGASASVPGVTASGRDTARPAADSPDAPATSPARESKDDYATFAVDPSGEAVHLPSKDSREEKEEKTASSSAVGKEDVWDYSRRPQESGSQAWEKKGTGGKEAGAGQADAPPLSVPKPKEKGRLFGKAASPGKKGKPDAKAAPPKQPQAKLPPFSASHPILSVEQSMPPSVGSRLFSALALSPLIVLTVMFLLQTLFSLDPRALWFSDEIRHADAFKNLLDHGKWLILEMNGAPYPDKPPLYFWFLRGLYELLRTDGPLLYFTAAAVSGLLFLWASVALGRHVARVDGRTNLAAGIILLSTGYFMGLLHYARMDLLFAALIICANIVLYRAFVRPRPDYPGMVGAFVLAGLACMVKGPLAFAFPLSAIVLFALWRGTKDQTLCVIISVVAALFGLLPGVFGPALLQLAGIQPPMMTNPFSGDAVLSLQWGLAFLAPAAVVCLALLAFTPKLRICAALSLLLMAAVFVLNGSTPYFHWPLLFTLPAVGMALFILWQLTPQRFFRLDFFVGLCAGLLVPALWLAAIYMETGGYDFILNSLLKTQVLERAVDTFHHKEPWHYYLVRLPLLLLPWVILVFFLPWKKLLAKDNREALASSRKPEREGLAYLWCMVISALAVLSLLSGKILIYLLPILPAFAILGARGVLALSGSRALFFRFSMALVLFLFGVASILGALVLFDVLPRPGFDGIPGWKLASHGGFYVVAAIAFVIAGLLSFGLSSARPEGVLLYMALGCSLLGFPLANLVAPSFDAVLSPKAQALIMRAYIQEGYTPASYKVYGGTYSFYTNSVINELKQQEDIAPLAEKGKLILGMRASIFDAWEDAPACLTEVHRQWIETREFVLLACPPIDDLKPAPVPHKESPDMIREAFKSFGIALPLIGGSSSEPVEQKIVRKTPRVTPETTAPEQETSPDAASPAEDRAAPEVTEDGKDAPTERKDDPAETTAPGEEQKDPAESPAPADDNSTPAGEAPAAPAEDSEAAAPSQNAPEEEEREIGPAPGTEELSPAPEEDQSQPEDSQPPASSDDGEKAPAEQEEGTPPSPAKDKDASPNQNAPAPDAPNQDAPEQETPEQEYQQLIPPEDSSLGKMVDDGGRYREADAPAAT